MSYTNLIFSRFDFVLLQIVLQETEIMNQGKTVFAQIMSLIPRYEIDKCYDSPFAYTNLGSHRLYRERA